MSLLRLGVIKQHKTKPNCFVKISLQLSETWREIMTQSKQMQIKIDFCNPCT